MVLKAFQEDKDFEQKPAPSATRKNEKTVNPKCEFCAKAKVHRFSELLLYQLVSLEAELDHHKPTAEELLFDWELK